MSTTLEKMGKARALLFEALAEHPGAKALDELTLDILGAVKCLDGHERRQVAERLVRPSVQRAERLMIACLNLPDLPEEAEPTRPIGATLGGEVGP